MPLSHEGCSLRTSPMPTAVNKGDTMPLPIQTPSQGHNWPDIVIAVTSVATVAGAPIAWIAKKARQHKKRLDQMEMRVQHLEDIAMTRGEMTASIEHIATALTSVIQHTGDKMDEGFKEIRERLDKHIDRG